MMWRRLAGGFVGRPLPLAGALAAVAIIFVPPRGFGGETRCDVPAELIRVEATLPHLNERLRARNPVKIVAIGGASTTGAAAGSPGAVVGSLAGSGRRAAPTYLGTLRSTFPIVLRVTQAVRRRALKAMGR